MKIETEFNVCDDVYVIRTTKSTFCKIIYVAKETIKEIGIDKSGYYINIGGVRSSLVNFAKTYFIDKSKAISELNNIIKKYKDKGRYVTEEKNETVPENELEFKNNIVSSKYYVYDKYAPLVLN